MTPEQAIETLRTRLKFNATVPHECREALDVLAHELERLYNDLGGESMRCEKAEGERDAAVAEADRLREALRHVQWQSERIAKLARAALAGREQPGEGA